MRFLLDTGVWGPAVNEIRMAGHDVVWTGAWPKDPGDAEILQAAFAENRILVTLDKDFGELAVFHNKPHCGIIRLVEVSAKLHARMVLEVGLKYEQQLQEGAIVTVEPGRVRMRLPEE